MQALWLIKQGFVKDIIEQLPEPRPKYSTVSTIVRILENKGFVGHKAYGKSHQYFPVVSKQTYTKATLSKLVKNYFGGSFKSLVHFFSEYQDLDINEVNEIIELLEKTAKR